MRGLINAGALLVVALALAPAALAQAVNGRTLSEGMFNEGKARIAEIAPNTWAEFDAMHNQIATFKETGRDDWSVYLNDEGRKIVLQLDVHRKMVGISVDGAKMSDYYPMTAMSSDPIVTGYKVVEVNHPSDGGTPMRLVREEGGKWVSMDMKGTRFQEISETGRTEWTVRLEDAGRKQVIELDCLRKLVSISSDGKPMAPFIAITRCSDTVSK